MAAILKIDGYDFFPWLRVAPGEGFDPADNDFLQPQFSEPAQDDGEGLISVHAGNKELAWPLHVSPQKDITYPNTKQGLITLMRDINRRLRSASEVEWRDDAATASTYFTVVFGRFEPDFNYRRAQKNWLSGTLRLWVRPYGNTGTSRIIGTAAGAVALLPVVSASGIDGDAEAVLDTMVVLRNPSGIFSHISGVAVAGASQIVAVPAASITTPGGAATLVGASGAFASQALRTPVASAITVAGNYFISGKFQPDLYPPGRRRLIVLARSTVASGVASGVTLRQLRGQATQDAGPTIVLANGMQWQALDLGIVTIASVLPGVDPVQFSQGMWGAASTNASGFIDLGGLLLLPEDRSSLVSNPDTSGNAIATYNFSGWQRRTIWSGGPSTAISVEQMMTRESRGGLPGVPVPSVAAVHAFAFQQNGPHNSPVTSLVKVRERFEYCR